MAKNGYQVATPSAGQPIRHSESIQKIYIFPYQDHAGNYYDTAIMYSVLEKSHWIGYPTKQVTDEMYDFQQEDED
jgi:type IV conjugative transfer system lipoprotein TraV